MPQLLALTRANLAGRVGKIIITLMAASFAVIGATAYVQIRMNLWNKPFYDALSRRDLHDFMVQLGVFFILAAWLTVLNVAQRWVGETLKLRMREALAQDLLEHWLQPRRAFWLANSGSMGENPDQRMHEDARHLCELTADLGMALLQSTILLISFSRRAVGALQRVCIPDRSARLRRTRIHALGRDQLCAHGLTPQLLGGPESDYAQRRALRPRGGSARRHGAYQRASG